VELTQDNTMVGTAARRERDRLQQLTGAAAPVQPQNPSPKPQTESQPPKN
jgi:hypothetical protein